MPYYDGQEDANSFFVDDKPLYIKVTSLIRLYFFIYSSISYIFFSYINLFSGNCFFSMFGA